MRGLTIPAFARRGVPRTLFPIFFLDLCKFGTVFVVNIVNKFYNYGIKKNHIKF
jgi:hypothetical protein